MEGPRALRKNELDAVRALTGTVFRPTLVDEFPQLFNEDNLENLRVCVDDGKCVSHVGMTERDATLFGCAIKVCCIGAVSTLKEYRGQGLASACFDDAVRKAFGDGVDVMIVSGDRPLYLARGCLRVGRDTKFVLTPELLKGVAQRENMDVSTELMGAEDLAAIMNCYQREPVRFIRPLDDYCYALQADRVMGAPCDFIMVQERGEFRGYVILRRPHEGKSQLVEFAGDRHAILAALPQIFRRYKLNELRWQVLRHDALFRSLCTSAGLQPVPAPTSGTVKLINFPQLMERLRPRFEELLGYHEAAHLSCWQNEAQYGFRFGDDQLVTDRDTATRLVFGTVEGSEAAALEGHEKLSDVLQTILPLPCLWYGLNYV
ncbi:MAG: GNAT family N-acetyltransferase [Abitibacteriaceae bacterium]|nr:GNAT family N-acetyltransferase [Abditibacteriaceae bacterium]MBV9867374.1 GNAT family N-acetyltransferase [Abditibacteriaceae bacterium]